MNVTNANNIQTLMTSIAKGIYGGKNFYCINKDAIKSMFLSPTYSWEVVYKRLIMIDALYSTNMNRRYYGLGELAEEIMHLAPNENYLRDLVRDFRNNPTSTHVIGKTFDKQYGIHKDTEDAGCAVSLLSKYLYFLLLADPKEKEGFPIYDNLAKDMYPVVCEYLGVTRHKGISNICNYIQAFNDLATQIGIPSVGMQTFDLLDAYLWRMGKFMKCNFSLLLLKSEYITLIDAVNKCEKTIDYYRDHKSCPISDNQLFIDIWNHWQNEIKPSL